MIGLYQELGHNGVPYLLDCQFVVQFALTPGALDSLVEISHLYFISLLPIVMVITIVPHGKLVYPS